MSDNSPFIDILSAGTSVATAIGVAIAASQLWLTKKQAASAFEDEFAREYRRIADRLPINALLGEDLGPLVYRRALDEFYHYFDLTNEQIFLRQQGRISSQTWEQWRSGIASNFRRPAFKRAWREIKRRSNGDFSELRRLEESGFQADPNRWPRGSGWWTSLATSFRSRRAKQLGSNLPPRGDYSQVTATSARGHQNSITGPSKSTDS